SGLGSASATGAAGPLEAPGAPGAVAPGEPAPAPPDTATATRPARAPTHARRAARGARRSVVVGGGGVRIVGVRLTCDPVAVEGTSLPWRRARVSPLACWRDVRPGIALHRRRDRGRPPEPS